MTTSTEVELDESPSVAEQPESEPLDALDVEEEVATADDGWLSMIHDVELGPEGFVYGAASEGVAYLDGAREWVILDLEGLPMGEGLEDGLPGRTIGNIEVGSDGVVWAAGSAHSTAEDEDFGGEIDGWFGGRYLEFVARGDCSGIDCTWMVYTSDDVPGLAGIGDLAVDATGTVYVAGGNEPTMFVFDGQDWLSYAVEELDNNVSPWSSSLAVTSDGTVWAGTNAPEFGRGLYAFDGAEFTHYTTEDGLPSDSTFQVSAYSDGGPLWVATDVLYSQQPDEDDADAAAGVISFDGTTWTVHTMADGLLTNDGFVTAGPGGTAWVLHSEVPPFGVARYDGAGWAATESSAAPGGFRSAADADGSLWFAGRQGLIHFDGTTTTVYQSPFTETATTVASSPLEAKYPVVVASGLSGEDTQEIMAWAPEEDGSWPVVYALHGTGGNAQDLAEFATTLAAQGVVVFAADYRSELMPTPQWQDAYRDAECGYRYARSVAADYGGDLDQPVTIVGHSLGASLALAMGLNEGVFGPGGEFDSCPAEAPRPDVVVPLSGCHYEYEGRVFPFDPEAYEFTYDESELVLIVGSEDDVCEPWQSHDAAEALLAEGFATSLATIDEGNHFTVIFHDLVGGNWLTLPNHPAGIAVTQTILDAMDAAR